MNRLLSLLAAPVSRNPGTFAAMALIFAAIPITAGILNSYLMVRIVAMALCQGVIWAWLVSALSCRRKIFIALNCLAAALMFTLCLPLIFAEKPLAPDVLQLIIETDGREAASFIKTAVNPGRIARAALLAALMAATVWGGALTDAPLRRMAARRPAAKIIGWGALIAMAAAGVAHMVRLYPRIYERNITEFEERIFAPGFLSPELTYADEARFADGPTALQYAVSGLITVNSQLPQWEQTQRALLNDPVAPSPLTDSINVVVIIGESYIKSHSPLYGYPLQSTPRISAEADSGRVAVFTNCISPANYTSDALRNILNLNSVGQGERWTDAPYFPLLATRAGWQVRLFDNQLAGGADAFDLQLSSMMRNPLLNARCYSLTNTELRQFDGDFISMVDSLAPPSPAPGHFDIYHLYGQHFFPADRFPHGQGFDRFTPDSIPYSRPWFTPEKLQYIADYDNATLYNDHVIARILDRYAGVPTIFIYFSDHGEEIYSASDNPVRSEPDPTQIAGWLKRQFDVPLFVIANAPYIQLKPQTWSALQAATARPAMLDNIGQLILSLAGVKHPALRPRLNLIDPAYACPPRITSTRRINYDTLQ